MRLTDIFAPPVTVHLGDCLAIMPTIADNSVDAVICDPPYHLTSIVERFKSGTAAKDATFSRMSKGFMGKEWDGGDIAFRPETWCHVLRILKPGGHLLAFSHARTYHRMACAIEDAGFEIRDMIEWIYGSGFPKSHDQGDGRGTALKPAHEPICMARKPLAGTVQLTLDLFGTGAINIDACRIHGEDAGPRTYTSKRTLPGAQQNATGDRHFDDVLYVGTTKAGRFPANLIHDGSDEVVDIFPREAGARARVRGTEPSAVTANTYGEFERVEGVFHNDTGSAARFFYCAKATAEDRAGSKHPTVKPIKLMRYLVRMVTPRNGLVLDPFAGSGTTLMAARLEGFASVGIEQDAQYYGDIRVRFGQ